MALDFHSVKSNDFPLPKVMTTFGLVATYVFIAPGDGGCNDTVIHAARGGVNRGGSGHGLHPGMCCFEIGDFDPSGGSSKRDRQNGVRNRTVGTGGGMSCRGEKS